MRDLFVVNKKFPFEEETFDTIYSRVRYPRDIRYG